MKTKQKADAMQIIEIQLSLLELADKINQEHQLSEQSFQEAEHHYQSALFHAKQSGCYLLEAKAQVKHGDWMSWLQANCPNISQWTANAYMRIARNWNQQIVDASTICSIRQALAHFSEAKDEPEESDRQPELDLNQTIDAEIVEPEQKPYQPNPQPINPPMHSEPAAAKRMPSDAETRIDSGDDGDAVESESISVETSPPYKSEPVKRSRVANDYYPTPDPIIQALLDTVTIEGRVLEPCAGHGAIAKFFPDCITNDPCPSNDFEPDFVNDAADPTFWEALDGQFDAVVTNPPYESTTMLAIVQASLVHSRTVVAMLVRLNYIEPCQDRAKLLQDYADNLRYFIPVSPRPQFRKDTNSSDNVTVAWLVWDKTWSWAKMGIDCPFKFLPGWR